MEAMGPRALMRGGVAAEMWYEVGTGWRYENEW